VNVMLIVSSTVLAITSLVLLWLWNDEQKMRIREERYSDLVDSEIEAIRKDVGDARVDRIIYERRTRP